MKTLNYCRLEDCYEIPLQESEDFPFCSKKHHELYADLHFPIVRKTTVEEWIEKTKLGIQRKKLTGYEYVFGKGGETKCGRV